MFLKNSILSLITILFLSSNLFSQTIDHWETIVFADDNWKYRIGDSEPPSNWYTSTFNDSSWSEDQGGLGYGDGDDNTIIPAANSLYLRRTFEVIDISKLEMAILHADFDDAFIAYLNGVEIGRANINGTFPAYDAPTITDREAQIYLGGLPLPYTLNKDKINQCLQNGNNTLAIQIQNRNIGSSDMSAIFFFSAGISDATTDYSPTPSWFMPPFTSSDLPILKITTQGQSIQNEPKIVAQLGIIDNGPGNRNYVFTDPFNGYDGQISIEIRGASSQGFPKKNYGFETQDSLGENNNVELLGMPKENDWILHGPYTDKSLIRNVLAYHLGNKMGQWAPRTRYCELFINDDYRGVYILMEKIKRDKNRVDIARLDLDDNAGDSLTGGYIVQVDREELGNGWWSPFDPFPFIVYQHPNADDLTLPQENYIRNYITDFETNLASANFDDPVNGYTQYIDVGSFVDHLLGVELSRDVDAYRLSSFLFKDKDSKGGKLNAGPFWDFNLGYGNADYCDGWMTSGWNYDDQSCGNDQPFWWDRLLEDPEFRNRLQCRWMELREGPYQTDSIMQFIDAQADILEESQARHFERWPTLGQYVWPNSFIGNTYQEEIGYLKIWITERLIWMDNNIDDMCETVAVNNLLNSFSLTVQPNPFSESIDFVFGENNLNENSTIKIYDALGQQIQILNINGNQKVEWDGKNSIGKEIPSGIYFYIFSNENNQLKSGRVIKQ